MTDKLKRKAATRRDRDDALRLQAAGTKGDTVLAHINPEEARLLDVLADGLLDGGGRNPTTGLLSFGNADGESGRGNDSNPGGVAGGPAGGNTGGGIGGNTAGGLGGLGGGYGGDTTNGSGGYSNYSNYGYDDFGRAVSKPGIADLSLAQMEAISKQINDDIDSNYQGMFGTGFNARSDSWASPNTFGRLAQELWAGPAYNAPGRYGMPNAIGPGIFGTAIGSFVGGPMSMGMRMGDAMGRAQSQQARDDTATGYGALGAHNSTGQDRDSSTGLGFAELDRNFGSQTPGTESGAAGLLGTALPGQSSGSAVPAMDPGAAQTAAMLGGGDSGAHTKTGLPQPVENLLMDYIWRGRQGTGFGW